MYGIPCKNPKRHPTASNKFHPLLKEVSQGCGEYDLDETYSIMIDEYSEKDFYEDNMEFFNYNGYFLDELFEIVAYNA